jgi:ParB family chromosome partitioning protein
VKVNTLEQTKAVKYAESLLADEYQQISSSVVKKITYQGKVAGNIKLNNDQLKISLNVSKLEEHDLIALENYLIHLLEKTKV